MNFKKRAVTFGPIFFTIYPFWCHFDIPTLPRLINPQMRIPIKSDASDFCFQTAFDFYFRLYDHRLLNLLSFSDSAINYIDIRPSIVQVIKSAFNSVISWTIDCSNLKLVFRLSISEFWLCYHRPSTVTHSKCLCFRFLNSDCSSLPFDFCILMVFVLLSISSYWLRLVVYLYSIYLVFWFE